MKVKIMSFNLRYWNPEDGENAWPNRKEQVIKLIMSYRPCVLGIQEGLYSMLVDLDQELSGYSRIGEGRLGGDEGEFCAIYYRSDLLEVKEVRQIALSETPDVVGSRSWDAALTRICTWGLFELKETRAKLAVFNTHLDHAGPMARLKSAELIWSVMRDYVDAGYPCVLTGDFNASPASKPICLLRSHLVDAATKVGLEPQGTFHRFSGEPEGEMIDYIFLTPDIKVKEAQIIEDQHEGRYPSDHFPILATIQLEPER